MRKALFQNYLKQFLPNINQFMKEARRTKVLVILPGLRVRKWGQGGGKSLWD